MKEVILHLGLHKTGSSSIQAALHGFAQGKVKTVTFPHDNHSIAMYTIFSSKRYAYHIWKNLGYDEVAIDRLRAEFLETLNADLEDENYEKLIISGEDLSYLEPQDIEDMFAYFSQKARRVRAVAYVRHPSQWVVSNTNQMILGAGPLVKYPTRFRSRIEKYHSVLGRENVHVYAYECALKENKSVVAHFARILGIELKEPARKNQSANPLQIALLTQLNDVEFHTTRHEAFALREKIKAEILKVPSPAAPHDKSDQRFYQSLFANDVQQDCQWLRDEIGIDYQVSVQTDPQPISSYFDAILAASSEDIGHFFSELGVQYAPGDSIKEKFFEVIFEMVTGLRFADFDGEKYLALHPDVEAAKMEPHLHYYKFGHSKGRRTS